MIIEYKTKHCNILPYEIDKSLILLENLIEKDNFEKDKTFLHIQQFTNFLIQWFLKHREEEE